MTTITEDYVSLETAKLLNIKGFKGVFHKHYWGYEPGKEFLTDGSFNPEYDYPAPTLQMTMKWLRERKQIFIHIQRCKFKFFFTIERMDEPSENEYSLGHFKEFERSTYEEACESAIKYCLENLI